MTTPVFYMFEASQWRAHVQNCWETLLQHHKITADSNCGTHVHVSKRQQFGLGPLKRIAQCIIHFEPAIEAIVPPSRRGNQFARSNWLEGEKFALKRISRTQAIELIGLMQQREDVRKSMCPRKNGKYAAWSFAAMKQLETIEFRKPPASTTAAECLKWAEFATTFIIAALEIGDDADTIGYLDDIPPNVGGLKNFLLGRGSCHQRQSPRFHEPHLLDPLWQDIPHGEDAHIEPTITWGLGQDTVKCESHIVRTMARKDQERYDKLLDIAKQGQPVKWLRGHPCKPVPEIDLGKEPSRWSGHSPTSTINK